MLREMNKCNDVTGLCVYSRRLAMNYAITSGLAALLPARCVPPERTGVVGRNGKKFV